MLRRKAWDTGAFLIRFVLNVSEVEKIVTIRSVLEWMYPKPKKAYCSYVDEAAGRRRPEKIGTIRPVLG